jgi:hypothetical protein
VAEEGHQGLQAHPGVDQGGGVGVPQLMRNDTQRLAIDTGQPGGGDGLVQAGADPPGSEALAAFAEHEVGEPARSRVRMSALRAAV